MSTCRWSLSRGGVGALIGVTVVVTAATVVVTAATVGVIEDIGASAPTAIAMAIVRIVDMAQLVRPRGMAAAGLIHTTTDIRAFVAPLAGIMAPAASMALGSTVAGDTPTGDIAAATVAVCTGDGRSPCGAGTAGASPAAEDRQRLISNASFEPLPSAMESRQGPRSTSA